MGEEDTDIKLVAGYHEAAKPCEGDGMSWRLRIATDMEIQIFEVRESCEEAEVVEMNGCTMVELEGA